MAKNGGTNRLARVIREQIARDREAHSALLLDTGTIQGDMSLLTETYPIPIPQKDYFVSEMLTLGDTDDRLTVSQYPEEEDGVGKHTHSAPVPEEPDEPEEPADPEESEGEGSEASEEPPEPEEPVPAEPDGEHQHDILIPDKMRWLKPGDRVLVAWVQHDAFVIMRFLPALEIG